jgi:hypothetical protein
MPAPRRRSQSRAFHAAAARWRVKGRLQQVAMRSMGPAGVQRWAGHTVDRPFLGLPKPLLSCQAQGRTEDENMYIHRSRDNPHVTFVRR